MLSNLFTGLVSPEAVTNVVNVGAAFLPDWLNPDVFLRDSGLGPWVIALVVGIIFAETGLLLGFFLPGDSMLFTAGMLMATGAIETPLWVAIPAIIIAAIVGNQLGFYIGEKTGPALYSRDDSKVFKREHVVKAHDFFERHGGKALILARFVPIVRTFVPVIIGVAGMNKAKFFLYNVIGAVLWGGGVTLLGAWLGRFEWVGKNIDIIFIAIVLLSITPIIFEAVRHRINSKKNKPAAPREAVEETHQTKN
ncbi:VTT domain-containing protein [Pseudoglutamicibacter albus]|uniref:VTT domain-containing protein n=1 Tax=Pseudoglutamicibacter albus TaxID=98671 RepID=UPI000A06A0A0|nr:VTT domain-containing protein [Pseudoglutamicibacter albus]MCG7304902.1 VTT domain-containing protein [Pseudoglutamicibacter albus]